METPAPLTRTDSGSESDPFQWHLSATTISPTAQSGPSRSGPNGSRSAASTGQNRHQPINPSAHALGRFDASSQNTKGSPALNRDACGRPRDVDAPVRGDPRSRTPVDAPRPVPAVGSSRAGRVVESARSRSRRRLRNWDQHFLAGNSRFSNHRDRHCSRRDCSGGIRACTAGNQSHIRSR